MLSAFKHIFASICLTLFLFSNAGAQTPPDPATAAELKDEPEKETNSKNDSGLQQGDPGAPERFQVKGDPITVTARSYNAPLSRTPGSIAILKQDDIDRISAINISNSFEHTAGIVKASDAAWGSEINIRGVSKDHVILMIDRARVNTATDINARFGLVDPFFIERVEVLKGPVTALYGSGNTGGVAHIITRSGAFSPEPRFIYDATTAGYSNGAGGRIAAFSAYNAETIYVSGAGSYRKQDDYTDGYGNTMTNSRFTSYSGYTTAGFKMNKKHSLHFKGQLHRTDNAGIPGAADAGLPSTATVTLPVTMRPMLMLEHIYRPNSGSIFQMKNRLYRQSILRRAQISNLPSPQSNIFDRIEPGADHHTTAFKNETTFEFDTHLLTTGVDLWLREISSSRTRIKNDGDSSTDLPLPEASRLNAGLVLEDDWYLSDTFTFNSGARYDFIQVQNKETHNYETWYNNPPPAAITRKVIWPQRNSQEYSWHLHAGFTHLIFPDFNHKLLLSRSYRAASLEERYKYIVLGSGIERWGNPDLEPEESLFTEYSFSKIKGDFLVTVAVFQNTFRNLITEIQKTSTRYELENVDNSRYIGGEISASYLFNRFFKASSAVSYTEGFDTSTEEYLSGVAPLEASLETIFMTQAHQLKVAVVGQAAKKHVPASGQTTPGWARTDLSYRYRLASGKLNQNFVLQIKNISDSAYREYLSTSRGYTMNEPGRSFIFAYTVAGI